MVRAMHLRCGGLSASRAGDMRYFKGTAGIVIGTAAITGLLLSCTPIAKREAAPAVPLKLNAEVIARISVGKQPFGIAITPDGSRAYVTGFGDQTVTVVDIKRNLVAASIPIGGKPFSIAIDPARSVAYVALFDKRSVSVLDLDNNTVSGSIDVGTFPAIVRVSQKGHRAYVTRFEGLVGEIAVIDTDAGNIAARIPLRRFAAIIELDRTGKLIYGADLKNVSIIDTEARRVTGTVRLHAMHALPDPTGSVLYVATEDGVAVVNLSTLEPESLIEHENGPAMLALSPDGALLYLSTRKSPEIRVIDTLQRRTIFVIKMDEPCGSLAFVPDGSRLYGLCGGSVVAIAVPPTASVGLTER